MNHQDSAKVLVVERWCLNRLERRLCICLCYLEQSYNLFIQSHHLFCCQALLSTKATGEKARAASYVLIIEIGQTYMRWHPKLSQQGNQIIKF
jgi:hypothetical protein